MIVTSDKNQELAKIITDLFADSETEVNKISSIKLAFKLIEGKEPELSYVGCNCAGSYCNAPIIHGFRFDGLSIIELRKKWRK